MGLGLLALIIISIDFYTDWLAPVRAQVNVIAAPFYKIVNTPKSVFDWGSDKLVSREDLQRENIDMRTELLIHQRKLQQMATLAAENVRLRQLLNSAKMISDRVVVAELISLSPDPLAHKVMINKGRQDGIFVGQPLLDAYGLMGQIIEVGDMYSWALLITDSTHALPVQVNRNGVRAVAEGVGDLYRLKLRHLPNTIDIRKGDLLVSSGLGQRFPVGYPVAEVVSITHDPGKPFAQVEVIPKAKLNRSRYVLIVVDDEQKNTGSNSANSNFNGKVQ
jgi:rod shape-determining protein MreC